MDREFETWTDQHALTFSVGPDPVAALAAVELVVVNRRSSATEGSAVGAAAEPRGALLLAAPELG
jgi:hypothetical protein